MFPMFNHSINVLFRTCARLFTNVQCEKERVESESERGKSRQRQRRIDGEWSEREREIKCAEK